MTSLAKSAWQLLTLRFRFSRLQKCSNSADSQYGIMLIRTLIGRRKSRENQEEDNQEEDKEEEQEEKGGGGDGGWHAP